MVLREKTVIASEFQMNNRLQVKEVPMIEPFIAFALSIGCYRVKYEVRDVLVEKVE